MCRDFDVRAKTAQSEAPFLMFGEGTDAEGVWSKLALLITPTQHLMYVWQTHCIWRDAFKGEIL